MTSDDRFESAERVIRPEPLPRRELPRLPAVPAELAAAVVAVPGLARVAASAGWHTAHLGVRAYVRTGWRLAMVATGDPDEAGLLAREATQAMASIGNVARAVQRGTPLPLALRAAGEALSELAEPPDGSNGGTAGHLVRGEPAVAPSSPQPPPDPVGRGRQPHLPVGAGVPADDFSEHDTPPIKEAGGH